MASSRRRKRLAGAEADRSPSNAKKTPAGSNPPRWRSCFGQRSASRSAVARGSAEDPRPRREFHRVIQWKHGPHAARVTETLEIGAGRSGRVHIDQMGRPGLVEALLAVGGLDHIRSLKAREVKGRMQAIAAGIGRCLPENRQDRGRLWKNIYGAMASRRGRSEKAASAIRNYGGMSHKGEVPRSSS
jgi:hypothetical protein